MLELQSDSLTVSVLDPRDPADADKNGARYCTGGYIFQVADSRVGELLTGPAGAVHETGNTFDVFNGQGFPDSFNQVPLKAAPGDSTAVIIGTGTVDLDHQRTTSAAENPTGAGEGVLEFCPWTVDHQPDRCSLRFEATQSIGAYSVQLVRTVSLVGRTITSHTVLTNLSSQASLPVSWFPHPFFPYPSGKQLFKMSTDCALVTPHKVLMQDEAGFISWQHESLVPRPGSSKSPDEYTNQIGMGYLETVDPAPLTVLQMHPKVGMVTAVCSFAPAPTVTGGETYGEAIPLWGNQWAVSWEPFLNFELDPASGGSAGEGTSREWSISYTFGEPPAVSSSSSRL